MESAEIVRRFLSYFEQRGHTVVPSASLVADDPTLLLVNAGMQPFKPYFLGQQTPPFRRATSCQKCVRTPDIEEVGKTTRHGTFFQMLGNFSFGDYFKEQAIPFAWELLTRPESDGGFGFPESRLWVTVLHDDDEAAKLWHDVVGVPESRIQRRGLADNYWHMGVPGPGGPCSEIYYDRGPEYGREGGPEADEDRYLEVWNLVFMQYQLGAVRSKVDFDVVGDLPSRNIDTGMGMERMAALLQGVDNIYEIDTMWKVLERAAELTEQRYGTDERVRRRAAGRDRPRPDRGHAGRRRRHPVQRGPRLRAAPDPAPQRAEAAAAVRAPSAAARAATAGAAQDERFLHELSSVAIGALGEQYPELIRDAPNIHTVIDAEEAAFLWHAAHRQRHLRRGGRGDQAARQRDHPRRPGVPAARHLRLPDRPDPGDGRRAGPGGRRGRVPPADGRAAAAGEGRRGGQEDRQRRHLGVRAGAGAGRAASPSPATTRSRPTRPSSGCSSAAQRCRRPGPGPRSRSSWTARRSTPRAAASWPTTA